jgi:hypothetical protein
LSVAWHYRPRPAAATKSSTSRSVV